ncbi:uncharacterized protein Fot_19055 [Forsythia ovata]|uniref:Uncharacterized protein n=1 Tax=Forsythia ovata TaxID=205694 RepID=A0ABD1VJZ7_9LAMI
MDPVSVLAYYGGEWNHTRSYDAYEIVRIILPLDCSFVKLVEIIMKELKRDQSQHAIKIHYQVMENGSLIEICSDSSVYFYIQVKNTESNLTKFPLCVDVEKVVCIEDNQMCLGNAVTSKDNIGHSQEVRTHNSLYDCFGISSISILPSIEEMGSAICEYVACLDQKIDENESDVIYRPSVEDVKRNAIFKNKELLVTSFALFAIHNSRFTNQTRMSMY